MIKPTVGRVVLIFQTDAQVDPYPALITKVWGDANINVAGFNDGGTPFSESSIVLVQDGAIVTGRRAEWMPYQVAQAAKAEATTVDPTLALVPIPAAAPESTTSATDIILDEASLALHKGLSDALDHAQTMVSPIASGHAKSVAQTLISAAHAWFVKAIADHQVARTAPPAAADTPIAAG